MKKSFTLAMVIASLAVNTMPQPVYADSNFPDILEMASNAAEGISEAAEQAGSVISDTAEKAGSAISDTVRKAGETISDAAGQAGDMAAGTAGQVGIIVSGFASHAGEVISGWAENAGKTADDVKRKLKDSGVTIAQTTSDIGNTAIDLAEKTAEAAEDTADAAIQAVSEAAGFIVDEAGHIVDITSLGLSHVTDQARKACEVILEKGDVISGIVVQAVEGLELDDPQNWETAKGKISKAFSLAYKAGLLGSEVNLEIVQTINEIAFSVFMNGYQYTAGQITLGKFAGNVSEVIVREGLPTGVGVVVDRLGFEDSRIRKIAEKATYFLICVACYDKEGKDIREEEQRILDEEMSAYEAKASALKDRI